MKKSTKHHKNIPKAVDRDTSSTPQIIGGVKTSIAQFEIKQARYHFITQQDNIDRALLTLLDSRNTTVVFLIANDLSKGGTFLFAPRPKDRTFLNQYLDIRYRKNEPWFLSDSILPRKGIIQTMLRRSEE